MRVPLLVLILLLGTVPMQVEADSGRAMTAEIVLSDYVWTSADEIIVEIYVSGAPFNQNITLEWELQDENGLIDSESIIFQMSGSTHIVQFTLSQFYQGGTYYDISVDVSIGSTIVSDNYPFTVLRNSLLEQASRSPSGGNLQPWHIYVINEASMKDFLSFQESWKEPEVPAYEIYPHKLKEPYKAGIGPLDTANNERNAAANAKPGIK